MTIKSLKNINMRLRTVFYAIIMLSLATILNSCGVSKEVKWAQPLIDTVWELESISGFTLEQDLRKTPTIAFEKDNRYGGFAGCNTYFGEYEIKGANKITFNEGGMTMMACQPGMETENKFIEMLREVDGFKVAGYRMELLKGDIPVAYFTISENIQD